MIIKESAENYLEAILMIKNQKGTVRSIDIANRLGFTKPSVSVAMKGFREEGYIKMARDYCLGSYISRCGQGHGIPRQLQNRTRYQHGKL